MELKDNFDPTRDTIRHGEVYLIPIKEAPEGAAFAAENGRFILGHSETGHHHSVADNGAIAVMEPPAGVDVPEGMTILNAIVSSPTEIVHEGVGRHRSTGLQEGAYEIRTQRGMTPEGWARAID